MKSLLQDGDVCELANGEKRLKVHNWINDQVGNNDYYLDNYKEDLSCIDRTDSAFDIIRVIRNGKIILQRTQPINKMMTFELNGETYPLATHENMKIIVDQLSELEAKVMELQAKLNEILK